MLRTVIFDFDGVITDSEILHFRAFNQVLGQYGIELSKQEYYKTYLGFNDADCYGQLIQQGLLKAEQEQIGNLIEEKKGSFLVNVCVEIQGKFIRDQGRVLALKNRMDRDIKFKIDFNEFLKVGSGKFFNEICFAGLSSAPDNQWFATLAIFPFQKVGFSKSFHNEPHKELKEWPLLNTIGN